jgi:hypothetical protein
LSRTGRAYLVGGLLEKLPELIERALVEHAGQTGWAATQAAVKRWKADREKVRREAFAEGYAARLRQAERLPRRGVPRVGRPAP